MTLNATDSQEVKAIKSRMAELGPRIRKLTPYTRPLGKSQQPFLVAQSLEKQHRVLSTEYTKLSNKLKRIYRRNGMKHL